MVAEVCRQLSLIRPSPPNPSPSRLRDGSALSGSDFLAEPLYSNRKSAL